MHDDFNQGVITSTTKKSRKLIDSKSYELSFQREIFHDERKHLIILISPPEQSWFNR